MLGEDKLLVSREAKTSMFVCLCALVLQEAVTGNGHQSGRKHICHGRLLPWRHHYPKISGSSPSDMRTVGIASSKDPTDQQCTALHMHSYSIYNIKRSFNMYIIQYIVIICLEKKTFLL